MYGLSLEKSRLDAQMLGVRPDVGKSGLGAFPHYVSQHSGQDKPPFMVRQKSGFDK
jgi:hypothetical protein